MSAQIGFLGVAKIRLSFRIQTPRTKYREHKFFWLIELKSTVRDSLANLGETKKHFNRWAEIPGILQ